MAFPVDCAVSGASIVLVPSRSSHLGLSTASRCSLCVLSPRTSITGGCKGLGWMPLQCCTPCLVAWRSELHHLLHWSNSQIGRPSTSRHQTAQLCSMFQAMLLSSYLLVVLLSYSNSGTANHWLPSVLAVSSDLHYTRLELISSAFCFTSLVAACSTPMTVGLPANEYLH